MQQPSATVDEVIIGWGMQDLMLRFSQFVCQRDLVSGALSTTAKIAAKIAHCMSCWIGPGMTPVCQLTDTDIAYILKSFLNKARQRLIQAMKQRAADAGEEPHFTVKAFEILTMVAESHADLVKRNADDNLIIKALRRNACFAWRPDLAQGKLVRAEDQQWTKNPEGKSIYPMKSHRYPDTWLDKRYTWLDTQGVPIEADWKRTIPAQAAQKLEKDAEEGIADAEGFDAKIKQHWAK